VGIAGEGDRLAALLPPPGQHPGVQRHPGIDLEGLARVGQGPQHVPVLVLEVVRVMRSGVWRPVADGVVDVGEDVERLEAADQRGGFRQVTAQHPVRGLVAEAVGDLGEAPAGRRGVHRGEDPVETAVAEQGSRPRRVPVRFAQLDAGQDAQAGEAFTAAAQAAEVPVQVERRRGQHAVADPGLPVVRHQREQVGPERPGGEVGVLGERHHGQADLHRALAGAFHRAGQRVPRPLAVHVAVGGQDEGSGIWRCLCHDKHDRPCPRDEVNRGRSGRPAAPRPRPSPVRSAPRTKGDPRSAPPPAPTTSARGRAARRPSPPAAASAC